MGFRSSSVSGGGITGFFGDRAFARSLMTIALPGTHFGHRAGRQVCIYS